MKEKQPPQPPFIKGGGDDSSLEEAFKGMMAEQEKIVKDKWGFWWKVYPKESEVGQACVPVIFKCRTPPQPSPKGREQGKAEATHPGTTCHPSPEGNKYGILVVKCADSVWRFELARMRFEMAERLNRSLEEMGDERRVEKVVFR